MSLEGTIKAWWRRYRRPPAAPPEHTLPAHPENDEATSHLRRARRQLHSATDRATKATLDDIDFTTGTGRAIKDVIMLLEERRK